MIDKLTEAKKHIIEDNNANWPYFIIRNGNIQKHILSIFETTPEEHKYITSLGIDIFFHEIGNDIILFFFYISAYI